MESLRKKVILWNWLIYKQDQIENFIGDQEIDLLPAAYMFEDALFNQRIKKCR